MLDKLLLVNQEEGLVMKIGMTLIAIMLFSITGFAYAERQICFVKPKAEVFDQGFEVPPECKKDDVLMALYEGSSTHFALLRNCVTATIQIIDSPEEEAYMRAHCTYSGREIKTFVRHGRIDRKEEKDPMEGL